MNLIVKDQFQKRIEIANWVILAVIFIPALIFSPIKFSLGVLLGGFISIINFHWMGQGLSSVFENLNTKNSVKGPVLIKFYIRLALTAVVLFFLIANNTVNVIGLLIGLSVVVINIVVTLMIFSLSKKNLIKEVI